MEKGSFQKSPSSRDSREFRDSRDSREPPDCGKQRRIRPFFRDSREFRDIRDSRDSSSKKTPFVMTPFSRPECNNFGRNGTRFGGLNSTDFLGQLFLRAGTTPTLTSNPCFFFRFPCFFVFRFFLSSHVHFLPFLRILGPRREKPLASLGKKNLAGSGNS